MSNVTATTLPVGALFRMSIESVATLLLQYIAGGAAGYTGLVSEADVRPLGTITNLLLVPCLSISSLGRGLSVEVFVTQNGWVLVVIGFVSSLCYAAIGFALRLIAKPEPAFARLFVIMLAIPNIVAIPIALTQSLCLFGAFDVEFEGDRAKCVERALAYIFLYVSLDSINTFIIAFSYMAADTIPTTVSGMNGGGDSSQRIVSSSDAKESPDVSRGGAGAMISGGAQPAAHLAASTSVDVRVALSAWPACAVAIKGQTLSLLRRPPVIAMSLGLFIGLTAPVQAVVYAEGGALAFVGQSVSMLGEAAVPIINLMVAFSLGHKLKSLTRWRDLLGSSEIGISSRTLAVLTLGRMVIVPAADGLILYAMFGVLPPSRLLRVLCFIEMAPPTASIVVLLTHLAKKPKLAQLCAFALVPQYLLVPLTLTATLVVALTLTQ